MQPEDWWVDRYPDDTEIAWLGGVHTLATYKRCKETGRLPYSDNEMMFRKATNMMRPMVSEYEKRFSQFMFYYSILQQAFKKYESITR